MANRHKPTALKILEGKTHHSKLNRKEPKPKHDMPKAPAWLSAKAKIEWKRIAKEMHRIGLLTPVDRAGFAAYCHAWAEWSDACIAIKKDGVLVEDRDGISRRNQYVMYERQMREAMFAAMREFGMSPRSRSGIDTNAAGNDESELEKFLSKHKKRHVG